MPSRPDPGLDDWTTGDPDSDPVADLVDEVVAHLHRHSDARERYEAARALKERLPHVQTIAAKQLETELGSLDAAAGRLGVTRQYIDRLYRETETPGPRADRDRERRPTHMYGRWLAACQAAAEHAARHGSPEALGQYDKFERTAMQTPTVYTQLQHAAERWLTQAPRRRARRVKPVERAEHVRQRMLEAEVGALVWVTQTQRHLTLAEQADVLLGFHSAQAEDAA
jgi:hypothetical protein